ncbi:MAG: hypothetical protein SGI73_22970 [Chloroflexota bacterium]|nr:hypothetical protein [Chloroflexota bacterium]
MSEPTLGVSPDEPIAESDTDSASDSAPPSSGSRDAREPAPDHTARIDRLIDAIDLIKENRMREAQGILRELIGQDADFEDAWLWMSVTVENMDQASLCLDNVLRVNPGNSAAAGALYRLRIPEMELERRRARLHFWRDMALIVMWVLIMGCLYAVFATYSRMGG